MSWYTNIHDCLGIQILTCRLDLRVAKIKNLDGRCLREKLRLDFYFVYRIYIEWKRRK